VGDEIWRVLNQQIPRRISRLERACAGIPAILHRVSDLDRKHVRIFRSHAEADDGGYMSGSPEERLSQVWELTQEAWSVFQGAHAEQRLQRDVAVLIRRKS